MVEMAGWEKGFSYRSPSLATAPETFVNTRFVQTEEFA